MGAWYQRKELQPATSPVNLGLTFNLRGFVSGIKGDRNSDLTDEIDGILSSVS